MIEARPHQEGTITCKIIPTGTIIPKIQLQQTVLKMVVEKFNGYYDIYDGDDDVTPRLYSQSLETEGKAMSDDVTVFEIPVVKTSNLQGGLTVLIG